MLNLTGLLKNHQPLRNLRHFGSPKNYQGTGTPLKNDQAHRLDRQVEDFLKAVPENVEARHVPGTMLGQLEESGRNWVSCS
jgi:hypothetical protein